MKFYFSGMHSYHSHFNRGGDRFGEVPASSPWLTFAFPSFFDWYAPSRNGRQKLRTMPGQYVILDSGAHSFFHMHGLSVYNTDRKSKPKIDVSHYHGAYMNFIETNWEWISYFVELDLADVFGFAWVQKMRRDLQRRGLWDKCIPAWHRINGERDFAEMLETPSRYIGLQGLRPGEPMLPYNSLLERAFEAGVRVHGFALTNHKMLEKYPFYSVDSTSWMQGAIYGGVRQFRRGRFVTKLASLRIQSNQNGEMMPETFFSDREKMCYSARQMKLAEHHFTQLWNERGVDWDAQLIARDTPLENVARYPRDGQALPYPAPFHELSHHVH